MAQRTQRAKAGTDKAKLEAAAEAAEEATPEAQEVPANGVFVIRNFDAEGQLGVDVQAVGDVKVTEIPTILRLGTRLVDSKLEL